MPSAEPWYGFIDESGNVSPFAGSRYFVVAALMTKDVRAIELRVKRTRTSLGRRARTNEMKASATAEPIAARLLASIAAEEIEIIATVLDKRAILRLPAQAESFYREILKRTVRACVLRHPQLHLWLDKRYTNRAARDVLEEQLREAIADVSGQVLLLHQEDSRRQRGLQAVDYICWAFYRKYEHNDPSLSLLLQCRLVSEDVVERRLW